jgi:hypothetical protein
MVSWSDGMTGRSVIIREPQFLYWIITVMKRQAVMAGRSETSRTCHNYDVYHEPVKRALTKDR